MMSAFEAYKEYIAIKSHFNQPSYSYFKYSGKNRLKVSSFNNRKDKLWFQKLAKHPDVHNFLVANFAKNEKSWIKDLAYSEEAEKIYKDWLKRNQSLSYLIKEELNQLIGDFDSNFLIIDGDAHPYLLRLYLGNFVSLETLCILLELTGAFSYWNKKMEYDPVYQEVKIKVEKYTPFIKYDKDKIKKILLEHFS